MNLQAAKLVARFFERIAFCDGPRDCWIWLGPRTPQDYGIFQWGKGRYLYAHHVSLLLYIGRRPRGHQEHTDHLCGVRFCVNPKHLEIVTPAVNIFRSPYTLARINADKTHCKNGHPLGKRDIYGARSCGICKKATLKHWTREDRIVHCRRISRERLQGAKARWGTGEDDAA